MHKLLLLSALLGFIAPASAGVWMIGDDDGFGQGVPNNANHPFANPIWDSRSAEEIAATNGAQFTDTYSTTHPGYSPQAGTVATFTFTGLGNNWSQGILEFDLADFQANTFGAAEVRYNGILQNWDFNDGYPSTRIHSFVLANDVLASINETGSLIVTVDRSNSGDFYGFDYALLSNGVTQEVPEPGSLLLFSAAMIGLGITRRRKPK